MELTEDEIRDLPPGKKLDRFISGYRSNPGEWAIVVGYSTYWKWAGRLLDDLQGVDVNLDFDTSGGWGVKRSELLECWVCGPDGWEGLEIFVKGVSGPHAIAKAYAICIARGAIHTDEED